MTVDSGSNGFARGLLGYSSAALAAGFLGLISAPLATRVFEPDVLGRVGIFSAYLALLQLIILAGFDQGYMRFAARLSPPDERVLLRRCLQLCLYIGTGVSTVCLLLWQPLSDSVMGERSRAASFLIIVAAAGAVIYRFGLVSARTRRRPRDFFILSVVFALTTKYLVVLAGLVGGHAALAIALLTIGYLIAAALSLWTIKRDHVAVAPRAVEPPFVVSSLARYSLPFLGTGLLSWGSTSVIPLLILAHSDFAMVGQFNAGLSIVAIAGVLQVAVLAYWMPFSFATYEAEPARVRAAQQALVFVIASTGCLFVAFSGPLSLLLGADFRETAGILGLLVAPTILTLLGEVCGVGLLLGRRSGLYALAQGAGALVTLSVTLSLLPTMGLLGAGIGMSLGALCTLMLRVGLGYLFFRPLTSLARAAVTLTAFLAMIVGQSGGVEFLGHAWGIAAGAVASLVVISVNRKEAALVLSAFVRELRRLIEARTPHS